MIIWLVSGGNCEASLGKESGLILGIFTPPPPLPPPTAPTLLPKCAPKPFLPNPANCLSLKRTDPEGQLGGRNSSAAYQPERVALLDQTHRHRLVFNEMNFTFTSSCFMRQARLGIWLVRCNIHARKSPL